MAIDITNLAVVFGETGVGQLTLKAWKDLEETRWAIGNFAIRLRLSIVFRNLVNKICKWAHDGLVSLVFLQ